MEPAPTGKVDPKSRPRSRKLYKRKGWKGFVHSYKTYITNGNYEKVEWDIDSTAKEVEKKDFVTIYKF